MITWDDVIALERDCRELANDDFLAEESEAQARERMTEPEQKEDDQWQRMQSAPGSEPNSGTNTLKGWPKTDSGRT